MRVSKFEDLTLLKFEQLSEAGGLVHAVTTRPWNMASHRGPQAELAVHRRRRLCRHLGLDFDRLTAPAQVHGPEVVPVDDALIGAGRFGRGGAVRFVDGLVTDRPGVPLLNLAADCVLLLVYDPGRSAVGSAHASWRGTLSGVVGNLVGQMMRCFGSDPAGLLAGIGPSAGPCCYRIDQDVQRIVASRYAAADRYLVRTGGAVSLDLWQLLADRLQSAGLSPANIEAAGLCTICDERFFSHRRDGPQTGRMALVCALT